MPKPQTVIEGLLNEHLSRTPLIETARGDEPSKASLAQTPAWQTDPLLSRDDIERETGGGVTRRWLELAAHKGLGPPMIKISRRCVRYRRSEFLAWLEARRVDPEAR